MTRCPGCLKPDHDTFCAKCHKALFGPARPRGRDHAGERRFRQLMEWAPVAYQVVDGDGRLCDVNHGWCDLLGYAREQAVGRLFAELVAPACRGEAAQLFTQLPLSGSIHADLSLVRADGSSLRVALDGRGQAEGGGLPLALHCFLFDLTERQRAQEAAREQSAFMETLLDSVPIPVFYKDDGGRYLGCNRSFEQFLGIGREDIIGRRPLEIGPPEVTQRYHDSDQTLLQHGGSQSYHWVVPSAAGELRQVMFKKSTFHHADGSIAGLIGTFIDLTELHQAEQALEQSEARARRLLECAPVAMLELDCRGLICQANARAEEVFGFPPGGLTGVAAERLIPAQGKDTNRLLRTLAGAGASAPIPSQCMLGISGQRQDGSRFPAEVGLGLVRVGGDDHLIASVLDVTDRKRAEARVRDLAERFALATEGAGVGVFDLNVATDGVTMSDPCCRLFGVAPSTFGGTLQEWLLRFHADDRPLVEQALHACLSGGRGFAIDVRLHRGDGQSHTLRIRGGARCDEDGRPTQILGACWDVTEYLAALAQLQEAKERAEAASTAKSRFLANMSHELRTPLNAVIGFSELLVLSEKEGARREQLSIILDAARNLLRLIQDVLDLSRIEAGRQSVVPVEFDLAEELLRIIALFRQEAMRKHLELRVKTASAVPPRLRGDPGLLRQILVNLIGNALKFTNSGFVELQVDVDPAAPPGAPGQLVFRVADSGMGVRPENQRRIFEMFEQEDDHLVKRFGGSGLGLAISRRLVALLGGGLWLESTPGVGSCFSFSAVFEVIAGAEGAGSGAAAAPVALPAAGESILVVDDDPFSRTLLRRLLENRGYRIVCVEDGAGALAQLTQQRFNVVLMDIQLPVISGIEITQRIRQGRVTGCDPALPVIAITAYAMRGDRERFLAQGMNDYVAKPLDAGRLLAAVERSLRPVAAA